MKTPEATLVNLPDGLRLVHIHDRSAYAGIFGMAVRAGSADERAGEHGLAHFVEHTIFKGTRRRRSWHIINRMESVGGELNAYTTKEETVVYSVFPAGNASRAIELVADLAINSTFPEVELEKERQVVIDEINSYRDTPSEAIFDDFEELALDGSPLAHNILGDPASVEHLSSADCRAFLDRNYRRENCVLFYTGRQCPDAVASMCSRYFAALPPGTKEAVAPPSTFPFRTFERTVPLDIHQCHALIGAGVGGVNSPQRHAVALLANITGGPGMNSLLNVELRERRGLVYSVETSTAMFTDGGLLTVYFGCDKEDLGLCRDLCRKVFGTIADGKLTDRAFHLAKKQYLGQLAIAAENRENRIMAAARATLFRGAPQTFNDIKEAVEAMPKSEIAAVAEAMGEASTLIFAY